MIIPRLSSEPRPPFPMQSPAGSFPPEPRPTAPESEERLLARLRTGEEEAYEELVRRYGGPLLAMARLRLRSVEDARDAVQETFLSVFRSLPRFRGSSSLSTWLHRILLNAVLMKIRTRSRHPEIPLETWDDVADFRGADGPSFPRRSRPLSAESTLIRAELRARVRAAVDSLPDSYRSVLDLRDLQELDTPTVARLLSTSPAAVRIRLHRARQALRARLSAAALPA